MYHKRDEVSGLHQHVDIEDGTHSGGELSRRNEARQEELSAVVKKDWPETMLATSPESHPALGNALSRTPKPKDVGTGPEHYGVAEGTPKANPGNSEIEDRPKGGEVADGRKTLKRS